MDVHGVFGWKWVLIVAKMAARGMLEFLYLDGLLSFFWSEI